MRRRAAAFVTILLACVGCSGDDDVAGEPDEEPVENEALCLDGDRADEPVVELIEPAIELAEREYDDPRFYEISADRQRVSVIVSIDDGTAEQLFFCGDGGYVPPTSLGEASGATFDDGAVDVAAETIFVQIDDELDDPAIVDFAIIGDGQGGAFYDAAIQSGSGGVLLVRLSPVGEVLAVQAQ